MVSAAGVPSEDPAAQSMAPIRLEYPRLDVQMPVAATGVAEDGQMAIPEDAGTAAWYRHGPAPGSDSGTTVIAAHAGSAETPEGPLYSLRTARSGDVVTVEDGGGGRHEYRVTSVERLGKDGLDFTPFFDRAGPQRLVLITCGGQWLPERNSYADNIIVVAEPLG